MRMVQVRNYTFFFIMCILNHLGCFKKVQILKPDFYRLQLGKLVRGLGASNFMKLPECP